VPGAPPTVLIMDFNAPGFSYFTNPSSEAQNSYSIVARRTVPLARGKLQFLLGFNEQDSSSVTLSGYPGIGVTGNGSVSTISHAFNNDVDFTITSVQPVPLPAPRG